MRLRPFLTFLSFFVISFIFVEPVYASVTPETLARKAVSEDPAESGPAIAALRAMGPRGLDVLFEVYGHDIIRISTEAASSRISDQQWQRLTTALDAVSQQRDSFASHLYWYTDIEQAKAVARATGKPILSLRLLGNLNEEFSCANSRFFRTVLYANQEVSNVLREHFVLHWKSVRPAPRVTIDFGDGRRIESTITGNSIHYVLDTEGRPIEALPGLYGPGAFLKELVQAETAFRLSAAQKGAREREASLRRYHESRMKSIALEWQADVARAGLRMNAERLSTAPATGRDTSTAIQAAPVAITKMAVEIRTLRSISDSSRLRPVLPPETDLMAWGKIAIFHAADARLDDASIALIRSHYPHIKPTESAAISRIVQNLERNLAIDTVRNEYLIHNKLHSWFINGWINGSVESLNEQVYAQLFQTPRSDPWLGLASPDTYTGLVDNGIVERQ